MIKEYLSSVNIPDTDIGDMNIFDIKFLLKKTGLTEDRLFILIEESRDLDLVIESIATKLSDDEIKDISGLSKKLRVKLILYSLLSHKDYDIASKSYLSDILSSNYDYLYCDKTVMKKTKDRELILAINQQEIDPKQINALGSSYLKQGKRDIGFDIFELVRIIKKSKELIH